jgi:hypothetical protein
MTRNEKHLGPYPTSPLQDRKRKAKRKKRLPLSNKLRTPQWIAKAQGVAAATQSKDLGQKLSKFLILVIVAHPYASTVPPVVVISYLMSKLPGKAR